MKQLFWVLLLSMAVAASAQNFGWFVNQELHPFGDAEDIPGFVTGDTINGTVHSNGQIYISGSPVFYEQVSSSADSFFEGPEFSPVFLSGAVFGMTPISMPYFAQILRVHANRYENPGPDRQQRLVIDGSFCRLFTWDLGILFDSLAAMESDFWINSSLCFFTEAPLDLKGTNVTGRITIGSAGQIRLIDDIRVGGPTSGPPEYRVGPGNTNYIGIVSEENIKVGAEPQNGTENSAGLGPDQMNQALTNIVINAAVVAEGSFMFEYQNDPDSGYVCDCAPDYRGQILLYGSLHEGIRGFHWRSNNNGTGYNMKLVYDQRFAAQLPPCFSQYGDSPHTEPDTLNFGDVPLDSTVWDTVDIFVPTYSNIGFISAPTPFHGVLASPYYGTHFRVAVSFSPHYATQYSSSMQVLTTYHLFQIPLRGRGVYGGGPEIVGPNAYPNPFNASTVFSFSLPQAEDVSLQVYDVNGRLSATVYRGRAAAGEHKVTFDARDLPSGVYFARLEAAGQVKTAKVLLVK